MTRDLLNKKKKGGFTLIDLIIVIAIILILAAIAIPKFAHIRENANVDTDISNAKNIHSEVISLIGNGTIPIPTSTPKTYNATTNTTITNGMQSSPKVKAKDGGRGSDFYVKVDIIGNVTVYAGDPAATGKEIYPNAATGTQYDNN